MSKANKCLPEIDWSHPAQIAAVWYTSSAVRISFELSEIGVIPCAADAGTCTGLSGARGTVSRERSSSAASMCSTLSRGFLEGEGVEEEETDDALVNVCAGVTWWLVKVCVGVDDELVYACEEVWVGVEVEEEGEREGEGEEVFTVSTTTGAAVVIGFAKECVV